MSDHQPSHTPASPSRPASRRDALLALVAGLETDGLTYCLLNDPARAFAPDSQADADFALDGAAFAQFASWLAGFCGRHGLRVIRCLQIEVGHRFFVLAWLNAAGAACVLKVDTFRELRRRGRLLLRAEQLLAQRGAAPTGADSPRTVAVPAPAKAFVHRLVKSLLKRRLEDSHCRRLTALWCQAPETTQAELERVLAPEGARLVARAAADGQWDAVRQAAPRLRAALLARGQPSLGAWLAQWRWRLGRQWRPRGAFVAFLGADGSGKSSVIAHVAASLAPAFLDVAHFHLRPKLGLASPAGPAPVVTDPHGRPPRGWVMSTVKLAYLAADYWLGYLARVRPRLARVDLVVFDRYFHDLLVDPRRQLYGGSLALARLVGSLLPKPQWWILLDAPPEVLQSRKQEVSFAESARQRDAYRRQVGAFANATIADAARPLPEVVRQVNAALLEWLTARARAEFEAAKGP